LREKGAGVKTQHSEDTDSPQKLRLILGIAAAVLLALTGLGCGSKGGSSTKNSGGSTSTTTGQVVLRSITVAPGGQSIPVNATQQFTAMGSYSDGSSKDITGQATWSSSASNIATVNASGMATAIASGSTSVTAAVGAITGSKSLTVTPILVSISVSPSNPSLPLNTNQQFSATGTWSDSSSQDLTSQVTWGSSDSTVASIDNSGMLIANVAGSTTITATIGSITGSSTVTVSAPTLTSIILSPDQASVALGVTQSFVATGLFSDGSSVDLASVTWSSSDPTVVSIDNAGLATTLVPGTVTISATVGSVIGTTTLSVLPAQLVSISLSPASPSLALGTSTQLNATGQFSDGSTQILSSVTWNSSDPTIATVDGNGLVNSLAVGSATVTAVSGSITGGTLVTVTNAVVSSIMVTPANPSIAAGATQQFTATATFSDLTTQDVSSSVTWTSSDGSIATVSSSGLASTLTPGSSTITASLALVSGSTTLQVTAAALQSISVTPQNVSMATGTTAQLVATGSYSDGTTQDLTGNATWSSTVGGVVSVTTTGVITARRAGVSTINAAFGGLNGATTVTVAARVLQSIVVTPANPAASAGQKLQFTATAFYVDGTTQDVSASAHWSTSSASLATINSGVSGGGLATAKSSGSVTISATLSGITGSTTLLIN
jgi:trimeric autotransporter adhesin